MLQPALEEGHGEAPAGTPFLVADTRRGAPAAVTGGSIAAEEGRGAAPWRVGLLARSGDAGGHDAAPAAAAAAGAGGGCDALPALQRQYKVRYI